jgi:DNA-directed RNA polymerase subunit omega
LLHNSLTTKQQDQKLNSELVKKALEKVTNPNVLVNMLSRRVRQLNSGNGGASRPMVAGTENQGAGDIALREIIEEKMGFEMPETLELTRPTGRNRRKPQGWAKPDGAKTNGEHTAGTGHKART